MKYVFALMDDETRYWIAQEVAGSKYRHDAKRLFRMGKEATGKKPTSLITDGLRSYRDARAITLIQNASHPTKVNKALNPTTSYQNS